MANALKVPSHGASWQGGSADTFVVADTVRSHPRPGSNSDGLMVASPPVGMTGSCAAGWHDRCNGGYQEHGDGDYVVCPCECHDVRVAAPLTRGSATGEGVNEPGRQEDDVNLVVTDDVAYALNAKRGYHDGDADTNYVAVRAYSVVPEGGQGADLRAAEVNLSTALDSVNENAHDRGIKVVEGASVRRLTPTECERLQAFPDGWTDLGDTPDSRRYAALGDAVTVSVAEWIGRRILEADA